MSLTRFTLPFCMITLSSAAQTSFSATPAYLMGLGEYQCFIIKTSTGKLYGISGNLVTSGVAWDAGIEGLPVLVGGGPRHHTFTDVASGMHNSLAIDEHGDVWTWGANGNGESGTGTTADLGLAPVKIETDSSGHPFTGVVQVTCYSTDHCNGNIAVKADGTVWVWGLTTEGMRGDGQKGQLNTRPVPVHLPGGKKIVKVVGGMVIIALASDGTVWAWGGNNRKELLGTNSADYTHPHQVPLPQKARDIAGGAYFSYALSVNGTLYGWGYYTAYMCIGRKGWANQEQAPPQPRDLTADLGLPHPIASVVTNSVSTHVILTDGSLWGWGDNACGCVGNGEEPDYAKHVPPYAWNWGPGQQLVTRPVRLAPAVHDFVRIFGGNCAVFYTYALTASGQLYSWGRNKSSVLGNGVVNATPEISAEYPNSWDVPLITPVDPWSLKKKKIVNSPYCMLHPDGHPCDQFRGPKNADSPAAGQ
jgi:alpha-tubulin suppressor-like RCC1 family protein